MRLVLFGTEIFYPFLCIFCTQTIPICIYPTVHPMLLPPNCAPQVTCQKTCLCQSTQRGMLCF
ncbi:hypothetical protein BT96DRAFT_1056875 [Gymnopus androsaceus JB14]|uniref:Uncharacterized protein n=1 Tax=Gymnopus androsaceus JB14 TaxID=1447944 RepID=A0A6A4GAG6_9AGAR|nr:hypothetical protein BT96DRAFT_1056875 [Gymnopus androsaceus JB14]